MAFRVVENMEYENLSGGYRTTTGPGSIGIDSVALISGRRPMSVPNLQPPGPEVPMPSTTQQHNRRSNITISYARSCGDSLMAGEVVFVSRSSFAAMRGHSSRVLQAPGSLVRVYSIEQVNNEFDAIMKEGTIFDSADSLLKDGSPFGDWSLDGIVMSVDHDDAACMRSADGRPVSAPQFNSNYAPLVNVAIQGYAEIVSDIEQDDMGRAIVNRKILPKKAVAGAVVYVGLFAVQTTPGSFSGKLIRFSSLDITNKTFELEGTHVCVRAWRVGMVVDTNKKINPRHITVAIDVRQVDTGVFMDTPRLPKGLPKEVGTAGDNIDIDWWLNIRKTTTTPSTLGIIDTLAKRKSVVDQLKSTWEAGY